MLVFCVSLVIMLSLRLAWFGAVNYDEGIYLLISGLFSQGVVPYTEIIPVTKPPLIFMINAIIMKLLEPSLFLARFFVLGISVLSAFLIYRITYSLVRNQRSALLASILFSVFSSLPLSEIFWVMTEPYVIVFELGALYFLIRARLSGKNRDFIFSGALGSSALMSRQTAGLFLFLCFLLLTYWKFKGHFQNKRIFLPTLLGASLPILLVILLFGYLGAFQAMVYQTTVWANSDVSSVAAFSWLRQQWFFEYFVFASPLLFLSAPSLVLSKKRRRRISDFTFVYFLFLWVVAVVAFYRLSLGPGYHHEYCETLAPLSILSSIGIYSALGKLVENLNKTSKSGSRVRVKTRRSKGLVGCLFVMLLILLCFNSLSCNLSRGEAFTNDYEMIREISSYVKRSTEPTDKLLVFETQQAKIGSLIYLESARNPVWLKRGFNCLVATDDERDELIKLLRNDENVRIVLIGGRPPQRYQNGNYIYDFIVGTHVIEKEFGLYTPYPGRSENLSVTLLRDLRLINYSEMLNANLSNFKGAGFEMKDGVLTLSEKYARGTTLYYPFDQPLDLSSAILNMQITGRNETNRLYIDLVDEEGRFMRHELCYSSNWSEERIPIDRLTFSSSAIGPVNIQRIRQINLVFVAETEIDLCIREVSLSNIRG
jgi:hypothetical protein